MYARRDSARDAVIHPLALFLRRRGFSKLIYRPLTRS